MIRLKHVRFSGARADYIPNNTLHRHSHYEILIIEKGGGEHSVDGDTYPVVDNQIFFLRPGQVHHFKPAPETLFYFLAFDSAAIKLSHTIELNKFEFFQSFQTRSYITVHNLAPILSVLENLNEDSKLMGDSDINQNTLVCSYLMIVLIKIQREFIEHNRVLGHKPIVSDIVITFNRLFDDPSVYYRFVQAYADRLHVSANYLNECVKRETGEPVSYWINEKILLESKRLISQSDLSLAEISARLQFPDATHFSRFFKRHLKQSPRQFRKSL
jgi:AraC family transcriptional regulator, transcriptional activator of pobA